MADWLQLLPEETIICRSQNTAKSVLVIAIMFSVVFAITYMMGEALIAYFVDGIVFVPDLADLVGSLARAFVTLVIIFFLAHQEEYVVTDHRVVNRHSPVLRVFMRNSEMQIRDIAEIKGRTSAKNSSFKLVSTKGDSLSVSYVPDLDRLYRTLVRLTGLPDPVSG